jgi:chromosome segregation ATPase
MAVSKRVRKFKPELLNEIVDGLYENTGQTKDIPKLRRAAIKWLKNEGGLSKFADGKISISSAAEKQIKYVAKRLRLMNQSKLSAALEKLATRIRISISDGDDFSVLYDLCKKFGSDKRKSELGKAKPEEAVQPHPKRLSVKEKRISDSATPNQIDDAEIKALRKALAKAEKRIAAIELKQNEFHTYVLESLNGWSGSMVATVSQVARLLAEHERAIVNLGSLQGLNDVGPQEEIRIPSGLGLLVDRGGALPIDGNAVTTFRRVR